MASHENIENFIAYILGYSERRACTCNACFGSNPDSEARHFTLNGFFPVKIVGNPTKEKFTQLAEAAGVWPYNTEMSYIQMGAELGDQGLALQAMAMGDLLKAWVMMTPRRILGNLINEQTEKSMLGMGMVTVKAG